MESQQTVIEEALTKKEDDAEHGLHDRFRTVCDECAHGYDGCRLIPLGDGCNAKRKPMRVIH